MLQFLAPKFMKEFDKKLLLNYPFWYIVKFHYILYFTILMWLLSYGIGSILPIHYMSYNPMNVVDIWIFMFGVLGLILFCVWVYYLTIYNNEDHFGKYKMWDDVKFLGIFMAGILLIMSFSYPMQIRVKTRLANVFTDAELAQQYNTLNLANKYITSDLEDFQYCGYNVHEEVDYQRLKKDHNYYDSNVPHDLKKYKRFVKFTSDYFNEYEMSYLFFSPKYLEESTEYKNVLLTEDEIEHTYNDLHKTEKDKLNAIVSHFNLVKKYHSQNYGQRYSPQDYLDNYNHYEKACVYNFPKAFNLDKYDLASEIEYLPIDDVSNYISNIYKAKFSLPNILSNTYLLFCFYFSFFISLFVIVFRNNSWQHYLVSVVSAILLAIILGIISACMHYPLSQYAFPSLAFLTWVAAAVISLIYYFKRDKYSVVGAVATNLFYICLPIMPLLICLYCHEVFGLYKCNYNYSTTNEYEMAYNQLECEWKTRKFAELIRNAQLIGIAVFVFGVMPFYKVFFAKQKALPRDK